MRFRSDEPEDRPLPEGAAEAEDSARLRLQIVPVAPRARREELPLLPVSDELAPPLGRRETSIRVH